MEQDQSVKKKNISQRGTFLLEVVVVFIGIFFFMLVINILLPLIINENSTFFGPLYFVIRAASLIIALPLMLFLSNILFESQKDDNDKFTLSKSFLKQFKITKSNFKYQFLFGLLILFLVFIPLDFLTYLLIPETLEYTSVALASNRINDYLLLDDYYLFLISVIIVQISVAFYEESLARGFLAKRGGEHFNKTSSVIISSLYFGLGHFAYFFNPISENYSIWIPIIWFIQAVIVGMVLSMILLEKKWIFPLIFAHALNNIISAQAVWNYLQGNDFSLIMIYIYVPLLIIGLILFIWQFSRIKEGIIMGYKDLKNYFSTDEGIGEKSKSDVFVRIIVDVLIALAIFIIGLII